MKDKQLNLLCNRFAKLIIIITLASIMMSLMCSCDIVNSSNEKPNNNGISLEQNFLNSCPVEANGTFDNDKMEIQFQNKSVKTITGWVGAIVYYDNDGNPIKGQQGNLLWGIRGNDTIAPNESSTWEYAIGVNYLAQARVYIYYVSFGDQTTWGCENLSETEALQYGEKFSIQRDLSQYYRGQCGLIDSEGNSEKSQIVEGYGIVLNLKNNSEQPIIAYEAIIVQYDVYGNPLKSSSDSSVYKTIKCSCVGFNPNTSDYHTYSYYKSTYYAEVYVYYVLFQDRTSWGYREYINATQALKYGAKFTLNKT